MNPEAGRGWPCLWLRCAISYDGAASVRLLVARDPIPKTRAALQELVTDVGGPSYEELRGCGGPATSTVGDLLSGSGMPRWSTMVKLVEACGEYHRRRHTGNRRIHQALVDAGRLDLQAFRVLFDEETGRGAPATHPHVSKLRVGSTRNWVRLGVHAPITLLSEGVDLSDRAAAGELPGYVLRETDETELRPALRAAVEGALPLVRLVVIVGESSAGKSRAAAEGARAVLDDQFQGVVAARRTSMSGGGCPRSAR